MRKATLDVGLLILLVRMQISLAYCYVMSAIELLTYKIENALCKTKGIALHAAAKQAWDANA